MKTWTILVGAGALAPLFVANALHAQDAATGTAPPDSGITEVVVTASKTGLSKLQRTPDAISVISGDQLDSLGVQNIKDMVQYVPNVAFSQNTASAAIYIRGIGSNNTFGGSDPDVTTQIDGVYIARPAGQMGDFLDLDRIEVLRGPQGTLYGRNAVGGTINILSKTPAREFGGEASLNLGNYNLRQGSIYLTGPLSDTTQGSVAANWVRHDGYFNNIVPGGRDVGAANHGGLRGQLRWQATSRVDATTRFDAAYGDEALETFSNLITPLPGATLANAVIGDFRKVALDVPQNNRTSSAGLSEEINYRHSDAWALKSITALRTNNYSLVNDSDSSERSLSRFTAEENNRQLSQEFDLSYVDAQFKGVTGLYFFTDRDRQTNYASVVPAGFGVYASPLIKSFSSAIFAQGSYHLTPELALLFGARYTRERKTMEQDSQRRSLASGALLPGYPIYFDSEGNYHAFTPKASLTWQVTPRAMLYGSVTQGYKSGGFNFGATTVATAGFKPEKLTSYEVGAKTDWLERRLRLNLTAFSYDYTDLQVQQLISTGVSSIGNAANARVQGVELELIAKPTSALKLTANLSSLDAHYTRYAAAVLPNALIPFVPNASCAAGVCSTDASGNVLNSAPKLSGLLALDYVTSGFGGHTVNAHLDYAWRDRAYFDASNIAQMSQHAYGVVNAQLAVSLDGGWGVQLWGKNLGNAKYYTVTTGAGTVPAGQVGDPLTTGLKLTRSF